MIVRATVGPEQAAMRLDDAARELFPNLSKGEIRRIVDRGGCTVDQTMVRVASRTVKEGNELILGIMEAERFVDLSYRREDLLYEDGDYLAVNKEPGFNSQRTPYQLKGTVEYAVDQYLKSLGLGEPARVIHRLDRGTSGVMFFPKHKRAATAISGLLKDGKVEKVYWALVAESPEEEEWLVNAPITKLSKFRYGVGLPGKESATRFRVLARGAGATLVEARPLTGRTHQIRVHLEHGGMPIIGDLPYGGAPAPRMMLHCRSMGFSGERGKSIVATAPVDDQFGAICHGFGIEADLLA
jgi:RluA family pseudouridine synthase